MQKFSGIADESVSELLQRGNGGEAPAAAVLGCQSRMQAFSMHARALSGIGGGDPAKIVASQRVELKAGAGSSRPRCHQAMVAPGVLVRALHPSTDYQEDCQAKSVYLKAAISTLGVPRWQVCRL
jgi:hypothetical protein